MTTRKLPEINAFEVPTGLEWDAPVEAREVWTPVRAVANDERTINMYGNIGDNGDGTGVTIGLVRGALRRMGAGDVTVNINSSGGNFFDGLAIYNLLREHDGKVSTNVVGVAASAASLIAMASDELRVAKAGFIMIHNAWAVVMGNRHELADTASLLAQFDAAMVGVYADRSGMTPKAIAAYMDKTTFFSGDEAVANGLADALLASDQVEADNEPAPVAALRKIDVGLARAGLTRKERRTLLSETNLDMPGAVQHATPGAGKAELLAAMQGLKSAMSV